jgi:glycosyltransferase involved in cell wall biosynthesis
MCGRPAQAKRLFQEDVRASLPVGCRAVPVTCGVPATSQRGQAPSPLRIGVLAPIAWRTPPRHYGPWEQFASLLADGLVAAGHDVTLFATADSVTTARLRSTSPCGWNEDDSIEPKVAEALHIAAVFEHAAELDIIHNGFDFLPLTYSGLVDTPVVTTIHGFSSARILPAYERYDDTTAYVAISDADRHPALHYAATIHHGIDTAAFAVDPDPGDHLLFFGRIHPDKGTAAAIDVAARAGRRLVIAGIIHDQRYYDERVAPHVDGDHVCYIGPVTAADRSAVLGAAYALLHLIDFDEPFGYSVVEAMACGTPVIAHRRGSMPELITDGVTGYLVNSADDAVRAIHAAGSLPRPTIRAAAVDRFARSTMIDRYVDVYRSVLAAD